MNPSNIGSSDELASLLVNIAIYALIGLNLLLLLLIRIGTPYRYRSPLGMIACFAIYFIQGSLLCLQFIAHIGGQRPMSTLIVPITMIVVSILFVPGYIRQLRRLMHADAKAKRAASRSTRYRLMSQDKAYIHRHPR